MNALPPDNVVFELIPKMHQPKVSLQSRVRSNVYRSLAELGEADGRSLSDYVRVVLERHVESSQVRIREIHRRKLGALQDG